MKTNRRSFFALLGLAPVAAKAIAPAAPNSPILVGAPPEGETWKLWPAPPWEFHDRYGKMTGMIIDDRWYISRTIKSEFPIENREPIACGFISSAKLIAALKIPADFASTFPPEKPDHFWKKKESFLKSMPMGFLKYDRWERSYCSLGYG